MMERSAGAPLYWDPSATEAVVREAVLELAPDVVLYQELPGMVPFTETHSMMPANPRSHSGNLATLVSNHLVGDDADLEPPTVSTVARTAVLTTFPHLDLTIANVHLAPGKGGDAERLSQITQVIEASPTLPLLIVGDTNMRVSEAEALVELGFSGDKPPDVTWDSRRNRFRKNMPEFSAYFTRWFASPGVTVSDVVVHREPVEYQSSSFFISDHYAMSGIVTVG